MLKRIAAGILWCIALFYSYGALVHVLNILSLSGFDWLSAPRKWQILDVTYLVLDLVVTIGFFRQWRVAYFAFYLAAFSQIILYTIFRAWILDVPEAFAISSEQASYLTTLVLFHCLSLIVVTVALGVLRSSNHE